MVAAIRTAGLAKSFATTAALRPLDLGVLEGEVLGYLSIGGGFPKRNLIVFLTFAVIFFTLVGQGLSLPALIRRLGLNDGGADAEEETRTRLVATKAALAQIDALAGEDWAPEETVDRMRNLYQYRQRRLAARVGKIEDDGY